MPENLCCSLLRWQHQLVLVLLHAIHRDLVKNKKIETRLLVKQNQQFLPTWSKLRVRLHRSMARYWVKTHLQKYFKCQEQIWYSNELFEVLKGKKNRKMRIWSGHDFYAKDSDVTKKILRRAYVAHI